MMDWVLGSKYCTPFSNEQFFDRYDIGKMNKFLRLTEANRLLCKKNDDMLKSLITEPFFTCNPKGKDPIKYRNYTRTVFTSNSGCPVDLKESSRRWVLFQCSSKHIGDTEFWTKIRTKLFTAEGGQAVARMLLAVDRSTLNLKKPVENEYQSGVVDTVMSSEERFVNEWKCEEPRGPLCSTLL